MILKSVSLPQFLNTKNIQTSKSRAETPPQNPQSKNQNLDRGTSPFPRSLPPLSLPSTRDHIQYSEANEFRKSQILKFSLLSGKRNNYYPRNNFRTRYACTRYVHTGAYFAKITAAYKYRNLKSPSACMSVKSNKTCCKKTSPDQSHHVPTRHLHVSCVIIPEKYEKNRMDQPGTSTRLSRGRKRQS